MRKAFFVVALTAMVLAGCLSVKMWYPMDGLIPFEYFSNNKNRGERLVYLSPVLASNHSDSALYIITNPEDIYKAQDKLGNPDVLSFRQLESTLKEFSPVTIQSTGKIGDGIGVFSLPPSVDKFFFVYIRYKSNVRFTPDYSTEVLSGILPLPPGSEDVFIGFSEWEDGMGLFANTEPTEIKTIFYGITGYYGNYVTSKKEQVGFIKIGLKERYAEASQQSSQNITQSSSGRKVKEQIISQINFIAWEDGCLTSGGFRHYQIRGNGDNMYAIHENDNQSLNNAINTFNNEVRRLDAISREDMQTSVNRSQIGDYFFVYSIAKTTGYEQGFRVGSTYKGGVSGQAMVGNPSRYIYPSQNYTIYNYTLWRVDIVQ